MNQTDDNQTCSPCAASSACTRGTPYVPRESRWIPSIWAARTTSARARADKVPFIAVKPFAGRKGKSDRAVLVELFTGAQCPPCVAADMAFDALPQTYKPTV